MSIEDVWKANSLDAKVGRVLLAPASWLYALGWEAYASVYRLGLKKPREAHRPVVCVGNLVVGGSGKTPLTLAVAQLLQEMGEPVVLGLSGYGSPHSKAAAVAPEGALDASEWGDEPAMVRWLAPDLPLIVGRRRVLAAELASQHHPSHLLLMDDGFQHLPLRKHVTLLLDPESPANARCLPAGPYREPRRNRSRADLVFGSRFNVVRSPLTFIDINGTQQAAPNTAAMLCAIGNPDSFARSLTAAGVTLTTQVRRVDHDPLTAGTLLDGLDRDTPLVVTAKDWVKLQSRSDLQGRRVLIALQRVGIEPEAEFRAWLGDQLARVRAS